MESRVGETLEKVLKTPKISIIVPVYNGEKYLEKSVDCILSQTLSDLELILVDDGSQDQSGAICDRYAREDRRVRVIHQENQGVSVARNMGIAQACGTYIGFVDADDWIAGDMLEQMLGQAQKTDSDVVMCDAWTVFEDGRQEPDTIVQLNTDCILDHKALKADLLPDFAGSACRCIYRTGLIRSRGICFPKGQNFSEDRVFNIYAMGYANRVCYLKKPLYMRFVNMESCVHRFHPDYFAHALLAAESTEKAVAEAWEDREDYQKAYLKHLIYASLAAIDNVKHPDSPYSRKECICQIRQICDNPRLQEALRRYGTEIPRTKQIQKRQAMGLYYLNPGFYQKIDSIQEVFDNGGIMGVFRKCISKIK